MYRFTLEQLNVISIFSVSSTACMTELTFEKFSFEIFEVEVMQLYYVNTIELMLFIGPGHVSLVSTPFVRIHTVSTIYWLFIENLVGSSSSNSSGSKQ